MILKFSVILLTTLILLTSAKINTIIELNEGSFSQLTNITLDQQHGSIISNKNSLIYFFIQGQQTQQHYQNTRKQFESTAASYLKSKKEKIIISQQNLDLIVQDEQLKSKSQSIPSQNDEIKQSDNHNNIHQIFFYIIKCPKIQQNSNQKGHICTNLGIYETQQQSKLFFFTTKSQILKYNQQITEEKLFLFISKVQEKSNFFESTVNFDEQLQKMAEKFELKNISLKNKAIGLMEQLKSYLSWDLLKFLVIFGVLPFLFGYLSSKSQQKANKQRMEKYGLNTQEVGKKASKQLKEQKKQ